MANCILVGCDLHDRSMRLWHAVNLGKPVKRSFGNSVAGRQKMIGYLKERAKSAGADRIVFAYEASGFGFVLWDELTVAGIECHVLAPTRMLRSVKGRKSKTDDRDTSGILNMVRSYVLAGVDLPSVWVPDRRTRDDREVVRQRLDVADRLASTKTKVHWLLKRHGLEKPKDAGEGWSISHRRWLEWLTREVLLPGAASSLASLLRQVCSLEAEKAELTCGMAKLAVSQRYRALVASVAQLKGVGLITAMTFLTEMGDLRRFQSRRQVGCYLGLTPSSKESGDSDDRKGHITHQGPSRVRKVLCQAIWSRIGSEPKEHAAYARLVKRNPKRKKIAVVARMRQLAILMWHMGMDVLKAQDGAAA